MTLDNCPLCQKIKEQGVDQSALCAVLDWDGVKIVSLLRHDTTPTPDELVEAQSLLSGSPGVIRDVDIPGHWALSIVSGDWGIGKSTAHSDDPRKLG